MSKLKSKLAKKKTAKKKNTVKKAAVKKSVAKPFVNKSRAAKSTLSTLSTLSALSADIWPQERDFLSRPERLRYVRKLIKFDGCVFCSALKKGANAESLCVFKNKHAMLVLNKYPYNSGHVMVLPTRHCGDLTELTEEENLAVNALVRRTVEVIKKEYEVSGLNIGLNMGSVAGAGLPDHMHWHIIPRWSGDTNFFPLIAETKVISESLEQTYERYVKHFKSEKL